MKLDKRRRREGKTNYDKRRRLLEGEKPRIVIRKTNKYIIIQLVESKEARDFVKLTVSSRNLLKHGWAEELKGSLKSVPASYLSGLLFGKMAGKILKGKVIVDTGLIRNTKGSRVYAVLKGIIDSGIKLKTNEKILPEQERITGRHLKQDFSDKFEKIKEGIK